jgi:hypothetical protein
LTPAVQDTSTARSSCCRKRRSKPTKYVAVISGTGTARPQSESPQRQRFSWSFELDGPWRARGLSEPLAAVRGCAAPQLFSARRISDSVGAGGASTTFAWEITPASHNATSRALDRGASSTVRWIRPALAIKSTARSTGDASTRTFRCAPHAETPWRWPDDDRPGALRRVAADETSSRVPQRVHGLAISVWGVGLV